MLYFHYIHCTLLYALYIYFIHCTSLYTLYVYYMHWTFIIDIVLLSFTLKFYYRHFSFIIYIVLSDFQSQSHRLLVNICLNSQIFIFLKSNLNNETHLDIHENLLRIAWPHYIFFLLSATTSCLSMSASYNNHGIQSFCHKLKNQVKLWTTVMKKFVSYGLCKIFYLCID